MSMNSLKSTFVLATGLLVAAGCSTPQANYVDAGGPHTLRTLNKINIQEWSDAANKMVNSLLESNKLQGTAEKPSVLAISRIVNNTTEQIDTDLLTKKIRVVLNKTGKVETSTVQGFGGAEDPLAKEAREERDFLNNVKVSRKPDYTLSGKIIEDRARVGDLRQTSYTFQLSLTTQDGLAVWEDEVTIAKQGTKAAVGF